MFKYSRLYTFFILITIFCFNFLFILGCKNTEQMICPKCGEHIQSNVNFCQNCGLKIEFDANGNILNENTGDREYEKTIIEIKSKWMILKYLYIYINIVEQTPIVLSNGQYHLSTKVSITSYSKSNDYTFNNAYFWFNYLVGGKQSFVRVDLDEKGFGSNELVLTEITSSPTKNYNFPIESCVSDAGGSVSYYE